MDIQKRLTQKLQELKSMDLAKSHLTKLEERILVKHKDLARLQLLLEKEYQDIQSLEKNSIRGIFERILGDKKTQLEKERQEYLSAALKYDECKKSLELLDYERSVLRKKLKHYNETKSELHNLIRQREQSLIIEDPLAQQLINDINKKLDNLISFKRELHEAIIIGKKVNNKLKKTASNLEKVISWGEYILNKPDQHIRKMVYINNAKENAYSAKQLLEEFEDELLDIYSHQNNLIQSSIKIFHSFIHSFFDNLISDWVVLMKIQNAFHTVNQVRDKVDHILNLLQHDLILAEKDMEGLIDKKEKIILELN